MIYIYGAGGRAKLIKEVLIRKGEKLKNIQLIDDSQKKYKKTSYLIKNFQKKIDRLYIGISDPKLQEKKYLYFKAKKININNDPLVDPSVTLKSNSKIGKNVIILENASIGPDVHLENNVFVGSQTIINHDCYIKKFTTIGHGTNLAGNVKVDEYCIIGISTTIKQNIIVEKNVKIGSGSNIIKRCRKNSSYVGNPAEKLNK